MRKMGSFHGVGFGVASLLLCSGLHTAHAEDGGFSKSIFQSWVGAYASALKSDEQAQLTRNKEKLEEAKLQMNALDQVYQEVNEEIKSIDKNLQEQDKKRASIQKNVDAVNDEMKGLDSQIDEAIKKQDYYRAGDLDKKRAQLQQKWKDLVADDLKAQGEINQLRGKVKTLAEQSANLRGFQQKAKIEAMRAEDAYGKVVQSPSGDVEKARLKARDMFNKMGETAYQADLLLTRFDVLKAKHDLNEVQLNALKSEISGRLDDTLLGVYVKEHVKKELDHLRAEMCSLQKECKMTGEMSSILPAAPKSGSTPSGGGGAGGQASDVK